MAQDTLARAKNCLDVLDHLTISGGEDIVHERGKIAAVLDASLINYEKRPSFEKFCHLKQVVEWGEKFIEKYAQNLIQGE